MKRILSIILILMLVLSGCSKIVADQISTEPSPTGSPLASSDNDITSIEPSDQTVSVKPSPSVNPTPSVKPSVSIKPSVAKIDYPDTYEEVWGDLEAREGGRVWGTLTSKQQSYVHYPKFNEALVYWTPSGGSYHSIDWCYTMENSTVIISGNLEEALQAGKTDPCSKCVGH